MKLMLPLTLTAVLFAGQAMAECPVPATDARIPNGSKATKDEMIAAQKAVKAFDAAVSEFVECMGKQQDKDVADKGDKVTDEDRMKIATTYRKLTDPVIDKDKDLAAKFNAELKAYKAKHPA